MHRKRSEAVKDGIVSMFEPLEKRLLLSAQPTAAEQEMLWLLNDMRTDPTTHLDYFVNSYGTPAGSPIADINTDLDTSCVDGSILQSEFAALTPTNPVAWSSALNDSAYAHSQLVDLNNELSSQFPGEDPYATRMTNAGYSLTTCNENVSAFENSPLHAHAYFAVCWSGGG